MKHLLTISLVAVALALIVLLWISFSFQGYQPTHVEPPSEDFEQGTDQQNLTTVQFKDGPFALKEDGLVPDLQIRPGQPWQLTHAGAESPVWSADCRTVFYIAYDENFIGSLWAIEIATGDKQLVVRGPASDPALSADGKWIVFLSGEGMNRKIGIACVDGRKRRDLTAEPGWYSNPVWLGSKQVTMLATRPGGTSRLVVNIESGKIEQIKQFPMGKLTVAPNSKTVAVVDAAKDGNQRIRLFGRQGKLLLTISQPGQAGGGGGGCFDPAFSPDGRFLVYCTSPLQPASDLQLRDLKTGRVLQLTNDKANNRTPAWSADGKFIAYQSARGGTAQIWIMPLKGLPEPCPTNVTSFSSVKR